jgi:hypothetical protein
MPDAAPAIFTKEEGAEIDRIIAVTATTLIRSGWRIM